MSVGDEEAVDAGFRSTLTYDFWPLEADPYLDNIRDDARFIAAREVIRQDIERMHRNVLDAESSGDWDSLRQIAIDAASSSLQASLAVPAER